jgi:two-component system chemotaxis sensor kinase CheA
VPLEFDATDSDLALFLEEAAEQLHVLSDGLLRLEREGDAQLIQALFRAAHTLKGSSATIGHTRMASLTHAMESVLDNVRNGALVPDSRVIDALLAAVDVLTVLNEEVETRTESGVEVEASIAQLQAIAGRKEAAAPKRKRAAAAAPPAPVGEHGYEVEVTIDPRSDWPAVRAYQALMELASLGTVVSSTPSEQELQSGEGGQTLSVTLTSPREAEALRAVVAAVSEIVNVEVRPLPAPGDRRHEEHESPAAADEADERRRIDLGPEMRGASAEEQLAVAGERMARLSRMVKVDIGQLDEMLNLVGELVIDRGRLAQAMRELNERHGASASLEHLADVAQHLARLSDEMQDRVMKFRLLPVESVFNRFPRMVRDLARKSGKAIRYETEGGDTGIDRSVIDELADPLLHLIRNAIDHGVETPEERAAAGKPEEATILLSAAHVENQIMVEVRDDGRGIDPAKLRAVAVKKGLLSQEAVDRLDDEDAINLIFMPGFSSAAQVTDVSGRGVGMDIVRTNIEKVNGSVSVQTELGIGTTFTIRLPLTLAIIRALLVRVGEAVFTVPLSTVQETLRIRREAIHTVQGREVVTICEHTLPLLRLSDLFGRRTQRVQHEHGEWAYIVSVRSGRTELGLIVDGFVDEQEVVIKSIDTTLGDTEGIAGATILGDGSVSMIVDVPRVVESLAAKVQSELARAG